MDGGRFGVRERFTYVISLVKFMLLVKRVVHGQTSLFAPPLKSQTLLHPLFPPPNPTSPKAAVDNRPLLHPIRYTPQVNNLIN